MQTLSLADDARQQLDAVRKTIGLSAVWRSANFSHSQRFADYAAFLNQTLPLDAKVVIPAQEDAPFLFWHTPYMQYFLMPRQVVNCTASDPSCMADLAQSGWYAVVSNPLIFPGELSFEPNRLQMFDENWGVLVPANAPAGESSPFPVFGSLLEITGRAVALVLWYLGLAVAGALLISPAMPNWGTVTRGVVGFTVSIGLLSFSLYVLMAAGLAFSPALVLGTSLVWGVLAVGVYARGRGLKASPPSMNVGKFDRVQTMGWQVVYVLFAFIALSIALGKGYFQTDGIILWAVKGYAIAEKGLQEGVNAWGTNTTRYPLEIPIMIAAVKTLFGDLLPMSKFIFPTFYLGMILIAFEFLKTRLSLLAAGLSTFGLAASPLLFRHASLGYANLPAGFYLLTGVVLAVEFLEMAKWDNRSRAMALLAGFLFALSAWTRPESFIIAAAALLIVMLYALRFHPELPRAFLLRFSAPMILYALIWYPTSVRLFPGPFGSAGLVSKALSQSLAGNIHFSESWFILRALLSFLADFQIWGVAGVMILAGGLPAIWLAVRQRDPANLLIFCGISAVLLVMAIYYSSSYQLSGCDISCWVSSGLDRFSIPGLALTWLGVVTLIFRSEPT